MEAKPKPDKPVAAVVVAPVDRGFEVRIGRRTLASSDGEKVRAPTLAVAEAIADDARRLGPAVIVGQIPLARLCLLAAAIERERDALIDSVARYAETDLVCYRAQPGSALRARQDSEWEPMLAWAGARYGAKLQVTAELMPVEQDPAAVAPLRAAVAAHTDIELAALRAAAGATGSVILALAWLHREIDSDRAWELGSLDERYQSERWGADDELTRLLEARRQDLVAADRFLALARSN